MYGHQVTDEHFGVTPDHARFFGVLCLKSDYTSYTDMVGLRNSHDRKFPVGVSFGSSVFCCDNLAFSGDHVIKRKHTIDLKRDLPGLIGEIIEPLAVQREQQFETFELYRATALSDQRADQTIMQMYRNQVIGVQKIADVLKQWEEPSRRRIGTFLSSRAGARTTPASHSIVSPLAAILRPSSPKMQR